MNPILQFKYIPITDMLLIVGLALSLFLLAHLWVHRRLLRHTAELVVPSGKITKSRAPFWEIVSHFLRLIGFAVLTFIIIGGSVLIHLDYQEITKEIAPAPSIVEIPEDLPFQLEEAILTSEDGIKLAGWYVAPSNDATIILLHGYGSNRTSMLWHTKTLVEAGYGVLMYDERGSGESEGKYRSHGWQDAPDVGSAIKYLVDRSKAASNPIGIAGCSIGGQIALQAAAYYPEINAVWADGASGILASDSPPPDNWANGIAFLSNYILDWMLAERLDIPPPRPMTEIIRMIAPRPIMLVAGGFPRPYFGNETRRILYYAKFAGSNSEVWIIPDAIHCDGPSRRPEEYAHRMVEFFNQALGIK